MKLNDIENVQNPIVYISLSIISGSLVWGFYNNKYIWLAALAVGLFFVLIYLSSDSIFTFIVILFFLLSLFNNFNYYNFKPNEKFTGDILISEVKSYYTIAEVKGRLLYIEGLDKEVSIGERLNVTGKFLEEINIERGSIGTIKISEINSRNEIFRRSLYKLRENVYEKLKENIGERKSALVSSVAFGYSDNLDEADKEEMKNLGIIHAISVSGLHVALVYSVLKKVAGIKLSLFLTVFYVLLTGAAFSSIRALIMIVLLNSAVIVRKSYNPLSAIALSAALITLKNPYAPLKLGFQLSFLATLGIIMFSKAIKRKLYKLPAYLNDTISISLASQVLIIPVMIIQFGEFPLAFLLGNLILVPLLNILIYIGNLMLIFVYIPKIFDFLSYIVLKIINILDDLTCYFDMFVSGCLFVNENIVIFYCFVLLSFFFFKCGREKAKLLPIVSLFIIILNIYSPILRFDYVSKGTMLVSYMGERKIISNTRNIDMNKLKKQNLAEEGYRQVEKIKIGDEVEMILKGKNYILAVKDKEYLLRLNNKENEYENYDIIDFVNNETEGFYLMDDKLYCF